MAVDQVLRETGTEAGELVGMEGEVVEMREERLGGWMMSGDQSVEVAGSMVLRMEFNPRSCELSAIRWTLLGE